jgi:uncharacterized protein (TIGR02300 family)
MSALLTGGYGYGKARAFRSAVPGASIFLKGRTPVVKPEWGTKRTCPKCGTRFYDLQQEEPVTCIACNTQWVPEPILKSKQPLPFDAPKPEVDKKVASEDDDDLDDEDLDIADEEEGEEEDVDLGGDDDLGVAKPGEDEES